MALIKKAMHLWNKEISFQKEKLFEIIGPDSNSVLLSQILEIKDIKNITLESSNVPKQRGLCKTRS